MKIKYKEIFKNYIKYSNIAEENKVFISNIEFINNNPDFYLYYPSLFSNYFDIREKEMNLLCIAGYLYYQSTIFLDKVIDEEQLNLIFPSMICQEEAIKILSTLFSLDSIFWSVWNKRKSDYKKAIQLEKIISKNPDYKKYKKLAALKSSFGNCAIDSLYHLNINKFHTNKVYGILLKTHDYFSVAYQLNDDILDFINDYKSNQFNWCVYTFNNEYFKKYSIEDCKKLFYLEGYATESFKLAISELNKALVLLNENNLSSSLWYKHINNMKLKFQNSIIEIENYIYQIEVETEKSSIIIKDNNVKSSLEIGALYIKKCFIKNQWHDYYNQGGISNIWTTAFVLSKIVSIPYFNKIFANEVKLASQFILSSRTQNNLWGYSTTWIDDADSTNFALISLHYLDLLENYNHDNWNEYFKTNYFSTYKNQAFLLESLSDNKINDVSGWCTDHHCVSAVSLYYLIISDDSSNKTDKLLYNFKSLPLNSITAYWWSDSIYTLYYLFLTYKKLKMTIEIEKIQNFISAKIKYDYYEDHFGINLFYTALALEILIGNSKYLNISNALAEFLIRNQFIDGSWLESNSLCIPFPNDKKPVNIKYEVRNFGVGVRSHEFNRLFTSISVLRSLYLWENQN